MGLWRRAEIWRLIPGWNSRGGGGGGKDGRPGLRTSFVNYANGYGNPSDPRKKNEACESPNRKNEKPSPMGHNFQSLAFYLLRFLYAVDLFGAWAELGGLSIQFARLRIVLNIAARANASIAMLYYRQFRTACEQLARNRPIAIDWVKLQRRRRNRYKERSAGSGLLEHVRQPKQRARSKRQRR